MAKWTRIHTDWYCEAPTAPLCDRIAEWEAVVPVARNRFPPIRCTQCLPADAEKIEDEAEARENVG